MTPAEKLAASLGISYSCEVRTRHTIPFGQSNTDMVILIPTYKMLLPRRIIVIFLDRTKNELPYTYTFD